MEKTSIRKIVSDALYQQVLTGKPVSFKNEYKFNY